MFKKDTPLNKSDIDIIQSKIFVIRGTKVMLDRDLAELYWVETRTLNQAVKRNIDRFPTDFMFQLSENEFSSLISQFVISNRGGTRKHPFAFTQNGIAMLSSVLSSKTAIEVNIKIMRVFVKTSELLRNQTELYQKIERIARQGNKNSEDIEKIFKVIDELVDYRIEKVKRNKIGFD